MSLKIVYTNKSWVYNQRLENFDWVGQERQIYM